MAILWENDDPDRVRFGEPVKIETNHVLVQTILRVLAMLEPAGIARNTAIAMNLPALCFAVLLSIGSVVLCGLFPAWMAREANLAVLLRQSSRSSTDSRNTFRKLLIAGEVALTFLLLTSSIPDLMRQTFSPSAFPCLASVMQRQVRIGFFSANSSGDSPLCRALTTPGLFPIYRSTTPCPTGTTTRGANTLRKMNRIRSWSTTAPPRPDSSTALARVLSREGISIHPTWGRAAR